MGYLPQECLHLPGYRSSRGSPCLARTVCVCSASLPKGMDAAPQCHPTAHAGGKQGSLPCSGLSWGSPERRALGNTWNGELRSKQPFLSLGLHSSTASLQGSGVGGELTGAARFGFGTGLLPHPLAAGVRVQPVLCSLWHRAGFSTTAGPCCRSATTPISDGTQICPGPALVDLKDLVPSHQAPAIPRAVAEGAGSSWDVSEQRHLCPFVLLDFLSEELGSLFVLGPASNKGQPFSV